MTSSPKRRLTEALLATTTLASLSACSAPDPLEACVVSPNEMSAISGWIVEDLTTSPIDAFADAFGAAPTDCRYDLRYDEDQPLTKLATRPVAIESLEVTKAVPNIRDLWFADESELGEDEVLTLRPDWGTSGQIVEFDTSFEARFEFDGRLWRVYTHYLNTGDLMYFGLDPSQDNYRDFAASLLEELVVRILASSSD